MAAAPASSVRATPSGVRPPTSFSQGPAQSPSTAMLVPLQNTQSGARRQNKRSA